jgi:hypothetical protein
MALDVLDEIILAIPVGDGTPVLIAQISRVPSQGRCRRAGKLPGLGRRRVDRDGRDAGSSIQWKATWLKPLQFRAGTHLPPIRPQGLTAHRAMRVSGAATYLEISLRET